jgi:hypothetical protein
MTSKDLTSRKFKGSDAGAEATEKRSKATFNKGGDRPDFGPQQATVKTKGTVGPRDVRGPGKQFANESNQTKMARFRPAAPAKSGITGNPVPAEGAVGRRPARRTRDYGKGR